MRRSFLPNMIGVSPPLSLAARGSRAHAHRDESARWEQGTRRATHTHRPAPLPAPCLALPPGPAGNIIIIIIIIAIVITARSRAHAHRDGGARWGGRGTRRAARTSTPKPRVSRHTQHLSSPPDHCTRQWTDKRGLGHPSGKPFFKGHPSGKPASGEPLFGHPPGKPASGELWA